MQSKFGKDKSILVPTDFSDSCSNALLHAIEHSRDFDSKIYLLHVVQDDDYNHEGTEELFAYPTVKDHNSYKHIHEKLQHYANSFEYKHIVPIIRKGDIFEAITESVYELNADLIFLGTHGKQGIQHLIGSYAVKVLDMSSIPVVIIQEDCSPKSCKTIVYPIQAQEEDRQKAEYAVHLAKAYNATIHLFPKVESKGNDIMKVKQMLNQIREYFSKYDVSYITVNNNHIHGNFDNLVLNYCKDVGADLLLIINNPHYHLLFSAQEESLIFNSLYVPAMCINYRKMKHIVR